MAEAQGKPAPADLMPAEQARQEILHVSKNRLSQFLDSDLLTWWPNPFDRRMKLVSRADVEALATRFPREQRDGRNPKAEPTQAA